MPKKAVSLTLEESNLLWLKGRARVLAGGSVSEAVDQLIDEARAGRIGAETPRSVVGTIDVPDDAMLESSQADLRAVFAASLDRAVFSQAPRPSVAKKSIRKK